MKYNSAHDVYGGTPNLILEAPAKINVGLRIVGKRPDGYHEIWSVLQEIDLCDEIALWDAPDFSFLLEGDSQGVPTGGTNLCLRAARSLQEASGHQGGARIRLRKVIPVGAGLGGGSSDAAAVLKGLNQLWETGFTRDELSRLGAQLGSDVPFFITGGCCLATGRGEIIKPLETPLQDPLVLVCPDVFISTEWAYKNIKNYHLTLAQDDIIFQGSWREILSRFPEQDFFVNDFEPVVFNAYPDLEKIRDALRDAGAYFVSLSGSGSALFGLFREWERACEAAEKLALRWRTYCLRPR